uniref:Uncharacterized protein n=1 Tax=Lactuca sativa TaxID=4236 RepID=A0A9R1XV07_LACSA|nr:hypothetical protein LSAT_V11C200070080 [Lactuca sativa]
MKEADGWTLNVKIKVEKDPTLSATLGLKTNISSYLNAEIVPGVYSDEKPPFVVELDGSHPFYTLDAYEEFFFGSNAGNIILFGKEENIYLKEEHIYRKGILVICSLSFLGRNPKTDKEENIYPRVFLSFVLNRPNPQVIVSWNGLVVSSFARASKILNNEPDVTKFNFPVAGTDEYMQVAKRSLVFIKENLYDSQSRRLQHSFRKGPSKAPGILDDYAS